MSIFTKWFELFKYQPVEDEAQTFNVDVALNGNWDKVDAALHDLDTGKEALVKNAVAKANPADADSVVLVDSADSSKTKRLTWTNIKAALSKVFAALKHTHPISDILDLAEEIAAIKAAMSNKAALSDHQLRTYTTLAQLGLSGAVTMEQVCAALPNGAELSFLHREDRADRISDAPFNFGNVSIYKGDPNNVSCKAYASASPTAYIGIFRVMDNPRFSGWIKSPTATPPTWYDVPLEAGWAKTADVKYGKDGAGKGYLVGVVNKASVPLASETILRLPEGYRPSIQWPVSFTGPCGVGSGAWATYGYLNMDGYLRFNGGGVPSNYALNQGIAFSIEFPTA